MTDTLHTSILTRMYAIQQLIRQRSDCILEIEHLTLHQVHALMFVKTHQPVRVRDLAKEFGISPASASVLADRLVDAGWIERMDDPGDRRVTFLCLTPSSTDRFESILAQHTHDLGHALDTLGPEPQQHLDDLLGQLLDAIESNPRIGR